MAGTRMNRKLTNSILDMRDLLPGPDGLPPITKGCWICYKLHDYRKCPRADEFAALGGRMCYLCGMKGTGTFSKMYCPRERCQEILSQDKVRKDCKRERNNRLRSRSRSPRSASRSKHPKSSPAKNLKESKSSSSTSWHAKQSPHDEPPTPYSTTYPTIKYNQSTLAARSSSGTKNHESNDKHHARQDFIVLTGNTESRSSVKKYSSTSSPMICNGSGPQIDVYLPNLDARGNAIVRDVISKATCALPRRIEGVRYKIIVVGLPDENEQEITVGSNDDHGVEDDNSWP